MNRFVLVIICLYLISTPFYVFPSGIPQPADFLIAFGGGVFLLGKDFLNIIKLPFFKYVFRILGLIILINTIYWLIYSAFYGIENRMYYISLFYVFNTLFMLIFAYVQKSNKQNQNTNVIALFIIISLFIQFVLALLGVQGRNTDIEFVGRPTLFFNNPNQLGYYALCIITMFFVLPSKYKKNIFTLLFTIFISSYLILYSGSRAALGGVILLSTYVIYKEGFKLNVRSISLIVISFVAIPFLFQTTFVQNSIDSIEIRNERNIGKDMTEAQIRGYDRIYLNPQYLFYGAGEGKNDRFVSNHQLEIHSGFGTMLFSYGILGLLMFLHLIYFSVRKNLFYSIMLLLPIIVYNITHNGLRSSLFWAVLVLIYIVNEKK